MLISYQLVPSGALVTINGIDILFENSESIDKFVQGINDVQVGRFGFFCPLPGIYLENTIYGVMLKVNENLAGSLQPQEIKHIIAKLNVIRSSEIWK